MATDLAAHRRDRLARTDLVRLGQRLVGQPAELGALPQLYAACAPGVMGGQSSWPGGLGEARGRVTIVRPAPAAPASDPDLARRLWAVSEQLTEVWWNPVATPQAPR